MSDVAHFAMLHELADSLYCLCIANMFCYVSCLSSSPSILFKTQYNTPCENKQHEPESCLYDLIVAV